METLKERMARELEERKRRRHNDMIGETLAYEGKIGILKDLLDTLVVMGIMEHVKKDAHFRIIDELVEGNAAPENKTAPVKQDLTSYADNAIMLGWWVGHDDVTVDLHIGPFFSDGQGSDKYTFESIPLWSPGDADRVKAYGETPEKMVQSQVEANLCRLFNMLSKVEV